MIRCTWYFSSGRESHSHDCHTIAEAYERLARTRMDAHAYPVGTAHGLYNWDRTKDGHTFELFKARMESIARESGK